MRAGVTVQLADPVAERANRNHRERIDEIQKQPAVAARVVRNVALPNATQVSVPHGLGRVPMFVAPSPARGGSSNGAIAEVLRNATVVVLEASGWGATVTVDLMVM
jgi:hypothetical protein